MHKAVWTVLSVATVIVVGGILGPRLSGRHTRKKRDEANEHLGQVEAGLNGLHRLYQTMAPNGRISYIRLCKPCADEVGILPLRSDRGKRRSQIQCERCGEEPVAPKVVKL